MKGGEKKSARMKVINSPLDIRALFRDDFQWSRVRFYFQASCLAYWATLWSRSSQIASRTCWTACPHTSQQGVEKWSPLLALDTSHAAIQILLSAPSSHDCCWKFQLTFYWSNRSNWWMRTENCSLALACIDCSEMKINKNNFVYRQTRIVYWLSDCKRWIDFLRVFFSLSVSHSLALWDAILISHCAFIRVHC